ncbi:MAG: flippase-like domain-containing protein [Bacteroidaceae bacterium]|nr:flippase-like domain-containing protein [Bacteroidaceae bacterium]
MRIKTFSSAGKIILPIILAGVILWWMYRGIKWDDVKQALESDMSWTWMLLSFPFGIMAQVFRALRWKQALAPLGEKPRLHTCINAVFISYGSSLVVPRVGEMLRCGILRRWEGTNFSRGIGTVVTERVIDSTLVMLLALITAACQIPLFMRFFSQTGVSLQGFLGTFTTAGWLVTIFCSILILCTAILLVWRLNFFSRTRAVLSDLKDGLFSVRHVQNPLLFWVYSLGIWACYYLHFYLTFYCFQYTAQLGAMAALVAFVVGCFAVLVPTPNGAGPWHFAVKTVLVLYGVSQIDGALFVLVVHSIQTLLVVVLGLYGAAALFFTKKRKALEARS